MKTKRTKKTKTPTAAGLGSRALKKQAKPNTQAPLQTGRGFFVAASAKPTEIKWSDR